MKKIIALMVGVLAIFNVGVSANTPETSVLDVYLPEACNQAGLYQQQKSIAGMSKLLETSGRFVFACDKGLLWHTSEPLDEALVYQLQGNTQLVSADGSRKKLSGTVQRQLGKMLNNLIGGNHRYLEKTFVVAATDAGIRLTPRSKRMEKFLRGIDITRTDDAVTIRMQHQGDEFTAIRVYQIQAPDVLSLDQCNALSPELSPSFSVACQQLFP